MSRQASDATSSAFGNLQIFVRAYGLKMARVVTDPTAAWKVENAAITASDMVLDSVDLPAR